MGRVLTGGELTKAVAVVDTLIRAPTIAATTHLGELIRFMVSS